MFPVHEQSPVKNSFSTYVCYDPDGLFWLNLYFQKDTIVEDLKNLYDENFNGPNTIVTLGGQIRAEYAKAKNGLTNKTAVNMVYYKLRILYIEKYNAIPPLTIDILMKDHLEENPWIEKLVDMRKWDKEKLMNKSEFPDFEKFVETNRNLKKNQRSISDEELQKAEELFLKHLMINN